MKWIITLAFLGLAAGPSALAGQELSLEQQMARYVFSPGTIMKHQSRLELTDQQEEAIRERTRAFQDQVDGIQWEMENRTEGFLEMLARDIADRDSLTSAFDGIVGLESEIKSHHMAMLLDIRGILTLDQRRTLQEIMIETLSRTGGRGGGGEEGRKKEL